MLGNVGQPNSHMGRSSIPYDTNIYKWKDISTLPFTFSHGKIVNYRGEIHLLGGYDDDTGSASNRHYKWNGTEWVSVSILPYNFQDGCAVVYEDAIHLIGGYNAYDMHYKYSNGQWSYVETLEEIAQIVSGSVVVYNNEIHLLGGDNNRTAHRKWDGTQWEFVSELPYEFYNGEAVVYKNQINILGGGDSDNQMNHYLWDGNYWQFSSMLQFNIFNDNVVVFNNELHIIGYSREMICRFYDEDYGQWRDIEPRPYNNYFSSCVVCNGMIHIIAGRDDNDMTNKHYVCYLEKGTKFSVLKGSKILCKDLKLQNESNLIYRLNKTNFGYNVLVDTDIEVRNDRTALTILHGREIVYADCIKDNTNMTFNLPKGARVNKILVENTGEITVPLQDSILLEY